MKVKKIAKRFFIGLFVFLFVVIGALIAIPYLFKDEILTTVKEEINARVNAKVDFADVDVSLLRSFPDFNLQLKDFSVLGVDQFEGITLAGGEVLEFTLNIMSVINSDGPMEMGAFHLRKPEINVLVLKDGTANYDIYEAAAETETTEETGNFQFKLKQYSITDANITYDDRQGDMFLKIEDLDHSGRGDFTLEVYDLDTKTEIGGVTYVMDGMTYLKKAKIKYNAGFNINSPESKYTLRENDLTINDLQVKTDGWVAMPSENIEMDLTFEAPQNNFKNLLSLIPNAYTAGYEDVKANGNFQLDGYAKGVLTETDYPSFKINMGIDNADIQYPDLPLGISDINSKILVSSPTSDLDKMIVDVSKFKMKIGNNPIDAYFKIKTPISNPDLDTKINGVLDLEELGKAFPMEGVETLNGVITANMAAQAKQSDYENGDYENINMSGDMKIENMNYAATDMPPVEIKTLQMNFNPKAVAVNDFTANLGKSDIQASGRIDNILAYFSPEKTMKGSMKVRSNYFNADEWMSEESTETAVTAEPTVESGEEELFDRFDFTLDAQMDKIDYDIYEIKNTIAKGNFTPSKLTIDQFSTKIGDSDLSADGYLSNVWNYVFKNETLGGEMNLRSDFFDLNQFMVEEASAVENPPADPEALDPILIPENIDFVLNTDMKKVRYTNMDLNNVSGNLIVANQEVRLDDVTTQSLGGDIAISGAYNTANPEKPSFDFNYFLRSLDFKKAFSVLNTFEMVAPIGKFIDGNFSSKLSMTGDLTKDMMPDINTLTADGFLHTINAAIKNFPPLEEMGNKLNADVLKKIDIKDSKNWFEIKDGGLELKEFDYAYQDISMKVGGSHKLTGGMDYRVVAKVPLDKIEKSPVGNAANSGLGFLNKEASKLGFALNPGEFVNVAFDLSGSATDPKVKLKLLGTEGEGGVGGAVAATLEEEAKKELDKAKEEAGKVVDAEAKKLEAKAKEAADKAKKDLEAKAKEEAGKVVKGAGEKVGKEVKGKVEKEVGKEVGKEADKVKKELEKWNPFGKKKKKKKKGEGE